MPLRLINLDDLTWEDFTAEARSLIPARSEAWTNHNASDPGITLVELFAYVSEALMYELNRITSNNLLAFLRLINGPSWRPTRSMAEEMRAAVLDIQRPHRAVTGEDFEKLTLSVNETFRLRNQEKVARAKCIFQRNLEDPEPSSQTAEAPGHVSVVVVPARRSHPETELLRRVKRTLEPARLLTTRIHVVRPRFVTVSVAVTLTLRRGADVQSLRDDAVTVVETFFDPLVGGFDGDGWPFGRSIYVSELYQLLNRIPGVDYVSRTRNVNTGEEISELIVAPSEKGRLRWNRQHELEAIELHPDELVGVWIDPSDITIVPV